MTAARPSAVSKNINDRFYGLGAAFFPEHHPRRTWKKYVDLLGKSGLRFVRIMEFAWDKLEPREGRFDFEGLDEVLSLLDKKGIQAILCTPTAVPPVWACKKYPDIFPVREDGKTFGFGVRRYTCPTSASYHQLSERIVSAMAEQYGRSRQVIGWQLDNEFGHPFCFCPKCLKRFQAWCRERFGTVQQFNDALCTHFLGQTIQTFGQIPFPLTYPHPGLWLIYHYFFSEMTMDCFRRQIKTLRAHGVTAPITTNMMVTWHGYDHEKMAEDLDVVAVDHYGLGNDDLFGRGFEFEMFAHAFIRGTKHGQNIWFNEFQCGRRGSTPVPGEVRWEVLTQIGRGANLINFFRFDTCPSGNERDKSGLLGVPARPGRIYGEVQKLNRDLKKIAPALQETTAAKAPLAFLFSHANHCEFARNAKAPDFAGPSGNGWSVHLSRHFRAVVNRNVAADIVYPHDNFEKYRVIVAPAFYILPADLALELEAFVAKGGKLMFTSFSGVADENARIWDTPIPAHLTNVFGLEVIDYGARPKIAGEIKIIPREGTGTLSSCLNPKWIDEIRVLASKTDVLAEFDSPFYRGIPALTRHCYGRGTAYYLGTLLDQNDYDTLYASLLKEWKIKPMMELPKGVHVTARVGGNEKLYFVGNSNNSACEVALRGSFQDIVSGKYLTGNARLAPFEVIVLKSTEKKLN